MHVGSFSIEKVCEKVAYAGKSFYLQVIQFSACSDNDQLVKFNRKGVLISNSGRWELS